MFRLRQRFHPKGLKPPLPRKGDGLLLICLPFQVRQLIKTGQKSLRRTLVQKNPLPVPDDADGFLLDPSGFCLLLDRKLPDSAMGPGQTEVSPGAFFTVGIAVWHTHQRPDLHQGLVEISRLLLRHNRRQRFCKPPLGGRFQNVAVILRRSGQNPQHISVHRRNRLPEGDGRDGPRRVWADPRQRQNVRIMLRHLPLPALHDLPGGLLHIPDPVIVSQPFPQLQQTVLWTIRQAGDIRQFSEKPLVIGFDRFHPGLLQHDLRHPDMVGIFPLPPGQNPSVFIKPVQSRPHQLRKIVRLYHSAADFPFLVSGIRPSRPARTL